MLYLPDLHYFNNCQHRPLNVDFIRGVLNAFEYINHKPDHGYSFDVDGFELVNDDIYKSLPVLFPESEKVEIEIIGSSKDAFNADLHKWFFEFTNELIDTGWRHNFREESSRREFINQFVIVLEKIISPKYYYKLGFNKFSYWMGLDYDYYVLTTENQLYIFHFSVSD